ncbi:MAG TPA: CAP domain-containing protein, partial [Anaerolineae bacterium]|nr:CAP domain-containing protein [Anaerolineae bacterium]
MSPFRAPRRLLVALIALVTLSAAAVLPAAHAAASTPTAPGQAANFVQRVVDLTNQERARQGLPPLVLDSALSGSALAHNEDMADQGFFSHTGSSGSSVDQRIAAAGREATDLQRLDWLDQEDLVTALVEGRKAASISQQKISYALNLGTIHNEATIIRLAAQGHSNEAIATLLGTAEGTIKNRRQRIRG